MPVGSRALRLAPELPAEPGPAPGAPASTGAAGPLEEHIGWRRLPRAALTAWHVDNAVGLAVALAALGGLALLGRPAFAQPWILPLAGLAVVAALVESTLVLPRRHRWYRYAVLRGAVVVESGALVRRQLVVPLHQVLYVETHQGPVLRAYGLARTRLGTIAEPRSVGPLTLEAARSLRRAVEDSHRPGTGPAPR